MSEGAPTIGYLPKGYPRISETFVLNEILELERVGLRLHLYPLKRPEGAHRQPGQERVLAPVRYLPEKVVWSLPWVLPVHLALFVRRPRAYGRALRYALGRTLERRSTTTLRRFMQAGFLVGWTLRRTRIRHFHAHFCHGPATVALFVKWLTGIPFSFTAHAKDLYLSERPMLREKMREAEFVVTCTDFNREYLETLGGDVTAVHLIYHGIDLDRFTGSKTEQVVSLASYSPQGRLPLLLSVGRLVEKKGFDTLIRACGLLRDRGLQFQARIYGEGPERQRLEALIQEHELENIVQLPGAVLQDELLGIYRQSSVFALPCQILENGDRDGLPNVLVEAMAMERPVVATCVSGIPELVDDGVNGYLVPPHAPDALAGRLETLLLDAGLRKRMGEEGRRKVCQHFDLVTNTSRLLALFQGTLDPKQDAHETNPTPRLARSARS